ncbi:hypothetical protein [Gorillibacterium sp. sgz5001074]|uniref:hypothetical protein n=1 Tax=Gorillibacterium sp. sgz5001074 TaxID=3446695 RepID=UPI003F67E611
MLFLRNRRLKQIINRHLPQRLRDHSEDKLDMVLLDLKAIKKHMGVEEGWTASTSSLTSGRSASAGGDGSTCSWAARLPARSARPFMNYILRRMKSMQKFLKKLASRKFWALVASLVTANMILFGYAEADIVKVTAVITQFGAVVAYILAEASVDKEAQKQNVYIMPGSAPEPTEPAATLAAAEDEKSFR